MLTVCTYNHLLGKIIHCTCFMDFVTVDFLFLFFLLSFNRQDVLLFNSRKLVLFHGPHKFHKVLASIFNCVYIQGS